MDNIILETKGLKKHFKTSGGMLHAVDDINIKIEKGKTLGVVGESGCGKSTLGRTVLRLFAPTGGEILFDGKDISGYSKKQLKPLRQKMQMIFQDPFSSLNPRMSVMEIIAEPMLFTPGFGTQAEIYSRVQKLMDTVGLAQRLSTSYPHELDGGRRQRIGIARALALNPSFIVCDEPVSALDVSVQAQILNLLMDLQKEFGFSYLFITHDLSVVRHISDEIVVMYMGNCVEQAPSKTLFKQPAHPYTQALMTAILRPDLSSRGKTKHIIRGEVTNPVNPSPGCRFAPRCQRATEACTQKNIPLEKIAENHFASCIHI